MLGVAVAAAAAFWRVATVLGRLLSLVAVTGLCAWLVCTVCIALMRRSAIGGIAFLTLGPLAVPLGLAFAVLAVLFFLTLALLAFLLFATLVHLALCFGQHAQIVFGVLLKVFGRYAVIAQLGIAGKLVIFLDNLLRRAAHFAFGARAVEHAVHDVAATLRLAVATVLGSGT